MLIEKACSAPRIATRPPWAGLDERLDAASRRYAEKSKTQEPAKLAHARIIRVAAATRHAYGEPDLIASRAAVDALQHQLQIEAELQLPNDEDGRFVAANSDEIAATDFAFDLEAETLEEALHREIEGCFPFGWPVPICSLTWHAL